MVELGEDIQARLLDTAYSLAKKNKLEADGTIWCWNCSKRAALIPSLHCPTCLADNWRVNGIVVPNCPNRLQTPADVEACRGP
jgi:hypothetical protein